MFHIIKAIIFASFFIYSKGNGNSKEIYDECNLDPIDIVFVMHNSNTITQSEFEIGLEAANNFTNNLDIGSDPLQSRIGFVLFDSDASVEFQLNEYLNNEQIEDAIYNLINKYGGNGTNIAYAMDVAINQVFEHPVRYNTPSVIIIITDQTDTSDVLNENELANLFNIHIYAIGIGQSINTEQLTTATGDSSRVYLTENYTQLFDVLFQLCQDLVKIIPTESATTIVSSTIAPSTTTVYSEPEHQPHSCGCDRDFDFYSAWLDIIFVLDTSSGVQDEDITTMKYLLQHLAMTIRIGSAGANDKKYSRVAIINTGDTADRYADWRRYASGIDLFHGVDVLKPVGGDYNVQAGLAEAQKLIDEERSRGERLNVQKVVVLFSSVIIDCRQQSNEICRLVSVMEGEKTTIITIAIKLNGQNYPLITIGSPCNQLQINDNINKEVLKSLCFANCYCLDPYTQFVNVNDGCIKYGECVYVQGMALSYDGAAMTCSMENSTISDILSSDKDIFLKELHVAAGFFPFWVGIRRLDGQFKYENGNLVDVNDYRNWCTERGQNEQGSGDCVYENQCEGFRTAWFNQNCGFVTPTHYFSCQKQSCSVKNYCDFD